jgi:nucleotide-binding universal stress UspA family protein
LPEADRGIQDQIETIEIIDGYPAEVILRRAHELKCNLIVLGAHDHGFSHTFLGTVAKRVLRRADIPTLVVPYRDDEKPT